MSFRIVLSSVLFAFTSLFCQAQTTASCDHWTFFTTFSASGINRWNTVVGFGGQPDGSIDGYIRYSGGGTEKFKDPNAAGPTNWTFFAHRNKNGLTVGSYRDGNQNSHGLMFDGSTMKTVDYPGAVETILYGLNKWNSVVGIWGLGDFSQPYDGFKMLKGGGLSTIAAPDAKMTNPMSISDTGIVVGWYVKREEHAPLPYHGFVLANGTYETLDYPKAHRTQLNDINVSGVIAGTHDSGYENQGGFIYVNGKFRNVTSPTMQIQSVNGINDQGYVTGTSSKGSYVAHCQ